MNLSHVDKKVKEGFHQWEYKTYGINELVDVTVTRRKKHNYLSIILDYSEPGAILVDMV